MRKSSVITIVLLVLVIIGLIVALVVTNLPQKESVDENTVIENNESLQDEKQQGDVSEETPTSVSLDNPIVKDMYSVLNGQTTDLFHYIKKGTLTVEDISNEYIQTIAYFTIARDNVEKFEQIDDQSRDGKLEKIYMDEAIKKIFGDVEYTPTYALVQASENSKVLKYDENDGVYYEYTGFGGGGNFRAYTAVTKVDEYRDRYIVTEKLVTARNEYGMYTVYPYYGTSTWYIVPLGSISDSELDSIEVTQDMYSDYDYNKKLISKYYDEATEYKHTFMKNQDGTYYWLKTEIVK